MTAQVRTVEVTRQDAVLRIAFNRPDRLNAVTEEVLDDLADLIEEVAEDDAVRVVVLTGRGRAFCSGADLSAGADDADPAAPPPPRTLIAANRAVRALRAARQPVVAAVNGPAVGVGCSLALACDLVVAADTAYFLLAFTGIGLMPDGGASALVPAAIGRARAMEMALIPDRIPADRALAWGLINRSVPADDLDDAVRTLVTRLADGPPRALAATKRAVDAAVLDGLDAALQRETDGQTVLLRSADFAEGAAAFRERRPPRFTGA